MQLPNDEQKHSLLTIAEMTGLQSLEIHVHIHTGIFDFKFLGFVQ